MRPTATLLVCAALVAVAVAGGPAPAASSGERAVVLFDTGLYLEVRAWSLDEAGRIRLEIEGGAVVVPATRVERIEREGRTLWTAASPLSGREASG